MQKYDSSINKVTKIQLNITKKIQLCEIVRYDYYRSQGRLIDKHVW